MSCRVGEVVRRMRYHASLSSEKTAGAESMLPEAVKAIFTAVVGTRLGAAGAREGDAAVDALRRHRLMSFGEPFVPLGITCFVPGSGVGGVPTVRGAALAATRVGATASGEGRQRLFLLEAVGVPAAISAASAPGAPPPPPPSPKTVRLVEATAVLVAAPPARMRWRLTKVS
jgi:hypothetical protein